MNKITSFITKAAKTISGVQAYEDRKKAKALKESSEELVDEINETNEIIRERLNNELDDFGRVRLEALRETVGPFLRMLEIMGKKNKTNEYDLHSIADISTSGIATMKQLDMSASEALKSAIGVGALAGVALSGTPTAVTALVSGFCCASTNTAISSLSGAAASNAVLAWLGGGSLATGGGGMAAGTAVLSGITWSVTGIFAVASAGIVASSFYSKKLTEATEENAEVEKWAEEVRSGWVIIEGIIARASELKDLTIELRERTKRELSLLEPLIYDFETDNLYYLRKFQNTALLVKAMTELAQTPLIDDDGNVSSEAVSVQPRIEKLINNSLK